MRPVAKGPLLWNVVFCALASSIQAFAKRSFYFFLASPTVRIIIGSLRIDDFRTTAPLDCVTYLLRMPVLALAGVEQKSTTLVRAS